MVSRITLDFDALCSMPDADGLLVHTAELLVGLDGLLSSAGECVDPRADGADTASSLVVIAPDALRLSALAYAASPLTRCHEAAVALCSRAAARRMLAVGWHMHEAPLVAVRVGRVVVGRLEVVSERHDGSLDDAIRLAMAIQMAALLSSSLHASYARGEPRPAELAWSGRTLLSADYAALQLRRAARGERRDDVADRVRFMISDGPRSIVTTALVHLIGARESWIEATIGPLLELAGALTLLHSEATDGPDVFDLTAEEVQAPYAALYALLAFAAVAISKSTSISAICEPTLARLCRTSLRPLLRHVADPKATASALDQLASDTWTDLATAAR